MGMKTCSIKKRRRRTARRGRGFLKDLAGTAAREGLKHLPDLVNYGLGYLG